MLSAYTLKPSLALQIKQFRVVIKVQILQKLRYDVRPRDLLGRLSSRFSL